MPTINEYKNEDGYYIRAHTSDAGNINYKIRNEGHPAIWKHGLRDGDEITWSTIQSLKSLGVIYTDESGTLGPDEGFTPDPTQLEASELSEEEARELLEILKTQLNPSPEKLAEVRDILGISERAQIFEEASHAVSNNVEDLIKRGEFPVSADSEDHDSFETTAGANIAWRDADTHEVANLQISVLTQTELGDKYTQHCVHLCEEHGLEKWHIRIASEPSWERKVVAVQQKSLILPVLVSQLQESGFELGDPSEQLEPTVVNSFME